MAYSEYVKSTWYLALFEEDCIPVMELLLAHPSLVKIGWEAEPSRQIEGRNRREGTGRRKSAWKGRTALHVGASRGCVELILQVLRFCHLPDFETVDRLYEKRIRDLEEFSYDKFHGGVNCNACEVRPIIGNRWKSSLNTGKDKELESDFVLAAKDASALLNAKDGEYGVDAVAIATLHGNWEILVLLKYGALVHSIESRDASFVVPKCLDFILEKAASMAKRKSLRQAIIERVNIHEYLEGYNRHRDFNFLPPEEYFFHYLFGGSQCLFGGRWNLDYVFRWVDMTLTCDLQHFLFALKDGQGRPPFHVAMEYKVENFDVATTNLPKEIIVHMLTAPDAAGRTPIHRAAARGLCMWVEIILKNAGKYEEVAVTCQAPWRCDGSHISEFILDIAPRGCESDNIERIYMHDLGLNSNALFNFKSEEFPLEFQVPHTPLHSAIIHGNFDCAELLIRMWRELNWGDMTYRSIDEKVIIDVSRDESIPPKTYETKWGQTHSAWIGWEIVEFALLAGASIPFVHFIIKSFEVGHFYLKTQPFPDIDDLYDTKREEPVTLKNLWCPLHIVASSGSYDMLRYFIDDCKCNPLLEDYDGNSALHHAMKVRELDLKTHWCDYLDLEHVSLSRHSLSERMGTKQILDEKCITDRKGCINRLLQAGCDVFKANHRNQLPYPRGSVNDVKFLSWWYGKQEKEFDKAQNNLNFAANAIAVTATLVATASYVGPLQPPMGYNANQIQYENPWVSIFIVCDTLSFYLAIVAITISLIPALPMPEQAMMDELQRTRGMVILAVGILLPSIFFVFVAFASSSISVMSTNITSEVGGILTILSTLVGMVLCFVAFGLFSIRLLAFIYPREPSIRKIYNASNNLLHRHAQVKKRRMSQG